MRICNLIKGGAIGLVIFQGSFVWAAATDSSYSYCGRVTDQTTSEAVVDGSYPFTFNLYSACTDTTPIWTSTQTLTLVGGEFCADLQGTTDNPLPQPPTSGDLCVEMVVVSNGTSETFERFEMATVPHALVADLARALTDSAQVTSTQLPSIPSSKLTATGVTAGSYTNSSITVNAQGQITAASSGSAGLTAPVGVSQGGTGATTATAARTALAAAVLGTNSDITSLTGLTTPITLAQGGTGTAATTVAAARGALAAAGSGANSDITSLTQLSTPITLAQGGTGTAAANAPAARTALGAAASGANSDITSLTAATTLSGLTAGSGTGTGRTTVGIHGNFTAVSNAGTAGSDLMGYTVPANTLNDTGDFLRITAWGTVTNSAGTKTIHCSFGPDGSETQLAAVQIAANTASGWMFQGVVVRTGAATQEAIGSLSGNGVVAVSRTAPPQTLSTGIFFDCTGTTGAGGSGGITQNGLTVEATN